MRTDEHESYSNSKTKLKIPTEYINRRWSRKSSPTRGEFIKIDDEANKLS